MRHTRILDLGGWLSVLLFMTTSIWLFQSWQGRAQARRSNSPQTAAMTASVVVAVARQGNMPVYYDGLGNVTAFLAVTVRTRVDGQLMNVYFREGQFVNSGDHLADIDPRPFQVQLEQAEGLLARDQATLANAKLDLERYHTLLAQDAIPEQQLATQESTVRQLEATIKADQAAIDDAKLQLVYCRITAPIDGRIGLRLVDPGNIVHASDASGLLVITQVQPIAVIFTLPEDALSPVLSRIKAGAVLSVDAYNRDRSSKLASGNLLTTDNAIDPNTGTLRFKAVFRNQDNALFPNQFVNVRLLLEVLRGQVIVPSAAIQRGPQGSYVYVVKPDNTAELRNIRTGVSEGDSTSINQGLKAGEIVVTDGTDRLKPGSRVAMRGNS